MSRISKISAILCVLALGCLACTASAQAPQDDDTVRLHDLDRSGGNVTDVDSDNASSGQVSQPSSDDADQWKSLDDHEKRISDLEKQRLKPICGGTIVRTIPIRGGYTPRRGSGSPYSSGSQSIPKWGRDLQKGQRNLESGQKKLEKRQKRDEKSLLALGKKVDTNDQKAGKGLLFCAASVLLAVLFGFALFRH